MVQLLGGWYILRDWNNADFDPKFVLRQLHVKYGVSPYFRISVEPDPYTPAKNIIRISPSGLGLPDTDYYHRDQNDRMQNAYKELIRDVVRHLSSTRNEAEKFGNDIFYYEKRIAEITPSARTLQNPITTCNHITVSELKETLITIPFYDILTAMYPEANIGETTQVIVTSVEYLTEISQIIASTDRKTMNGYLMWTLVRNYLPYLSEKFTAAVDTFNAELFGVREPLKRWEVCANLAYQFMDLAINQIDDKLNPLRNDTLHIINETYYSILNVVRNKIKKYQSSSPVLHNQLVEKLATIKLQIGLPQKAKDSAYLKEYYAKLTIIKANLFESVKSGIDFRRKLDEKLLTKWAWEDNVIRRLGKVLPEVVYSPNDNLIIIPKSLLRHPFFESKFPRSVIYGRVGVEIAHAMVSAVLPYDSFWTGGNKLLSPFHQTVNDSVKSVLKTQNCLYKYFLSLNMDLPFDLLGETALSTLKHVTAISVANEALELSANSEHVHQPTLEEYEESALFFLSYAQTQCSETTKQYAEYDNLVHFNLNQRSLLHVVWSQLAEFSQSFDCSFNKQSSCPSVF